MQPAIKWAAVILLVALIAVIGMIILIKPDSDAGMTAADEASIPEENVTTEPDPQSQEDLALSDPTDDPAQSTTMYEGALAGLSEDEIAALAIAEEESHERTEDDSSGAESDVD